MFQNSALPTATVNLPHTLQQSGVVRGLKGLPIWLPLPRTGREYLLWTAIMVALAVLITVQLWLSLQIAEADQTLAVLRAEYTVVEQENAELLWQISQYTALNRIQTEAIQVGYVPGLQREYRWASDAPILAGGEFEAVASIPAHALSTAPSTPWYQSWSDAVARWWHPRSDSLSQRWQGWSAAILLRLDQ